MNVHESTAPVRVLHAGDAPGERDTEHRTAPGAVEVETLAKRTMARKAVPTDRVVERDAQSRDTAVPVEEVAQRSATIAGKETSAAGTPVSRDRSREELPHRALAQASHLAFLETQLNALNHLPKLTLIPATAKEEFAWAVWIALRAGLSQTDVANALGVSQSTLSRWARGEHVPPNPVIQEAYLATLKECFEKFIEDVRSHSRPQAPNRPGPRLGRLAP